MNNIEVVGLGALNMDYIYQIDIILGDGETAAGPTIYPEADRKRMGACPGGSAANTIYGLAKLGVNTGFIGAIGDDTEGKILLQDFEKAGVDTGQIKVKPKAKTGLATCLSDKLNFRKISVSPGSANSLLAMNDIDLDYLNRVEVLHISSFVDDAQFEILLELVNKLDSSVKISFSPGELYATKGIRTLTPILARTYVLFANGKEVEQLTGEGFKAGAEVCLNLGCHIVVVTLGKGLELELQREVPSRRRVTAVSYIRDARDAEGEYVIKPKKQNVAPVVDTTGAGDAFTAGFLYGLLTNKRLETCGRLGDIVARFSVTKVGARQGLPTLKELSQRYRELYNKEL